MADEKSMLVDYNSSNSTTDKIPQKSSPSQSSASPAEQAARKEAQEYLTKAEGYLKSTSGFFGLFSSGPDYYEAINAYQLAGNILKEARLCNERMN